MAPTPVPLPRHICDALGLSAHEAAFREGSATIVLPSKEAAFLNPVQEFNRDLSILAIRAWGSIRNDEKRARFERSQAKKQIKSRKRGLADAAGASKRHRTGTVGEASQLAHHDEEDNDDAGSAAVDQNTKDDETSRQPQQNGHRPTVYRNYRFTVLEALSATGLRSIRYAREIPSLRYVVANDLSSTAVDAMKRNVALNFPEGRSIEPWVPSVLEEKNAASTSKTTLDDQVVTDLENGIAAAKETAAARASERELAKSDTATKTAASVNHSIHPDCNIRLNEGDAITLMYTHREERKRFDVIDLDPYGSATMFLDGAVQSVADGGLLCVTCTDSAVLSGTSYPEKAFSAYGGVTTKAEYSHEFGLRLVLHAISASAARYGRYVEPMLSLSIDFYVRLFVRVWTRPAEVKKLASHTGCVFTCSGCQLPSPLPFGRHILNETRSGQTLDKFQAGAGPVVGPHCDECGSRFHTAGPMWLGPLHNVDFCKRMLDTLDAPAEQGRFATAPRIRGMVGIAADELLGDEAPFYFTPSKLSGLFHTQSPPLATIVSALLHAGYAVSRAHATPGSLKTTAPRTALYDLWRAWIQRNPVKLESVSESSPTYMLLTGRRAQPSASSNGGGAALDAETGNADEMAAATDANGDADTTLPGALKKDASALLPPKKEWNLDAQHPDAKAVLEGTLSAKGTKYQINPLPHWGPGTAAKSTPRGRT